MKMEEHKIISKIARKGSDKEEIADEITRNPGMLPCLFEGLKSDKADVKYGCEKTLRFISEKKPDLLYPHFDFFSQLLDAENSFLKWGAIRTIANLTKVDTDGKFDRIFDRYFASIAGTVMITAANTIVSAAGVALNKPYLTERITREILKVEKGKYQTPECVNIACGHAIDSFHQFYEQIQDKKTVIEFIKRQLGNTRGPVRRRAEKFLRRHKIAC